MKPAAASFVHRAIDILLEGIKENNPLQDFDRIPTGREADSLEFVNALSTTFSWMSKALERYTTSVRRTHNGLLPIHQLPPEILTDIILDSFQSPRATRLKELASVSSYWKLFILTTPPLWCHISSFDPPASVVTSLSRSRRFPLHVDLFGGIAAQGVWSQRDVSDAIQAVVRDVGRWKHVRLEVDVYSYDDLLPLQATTAPILEALKITFNTHPHDSYQSRIAERTINLFGGQADRLRALLLGGIAVPWNSGLLTQVRILALNDIPVSALQLYTLLDSNPNLEGLTVTGVPLPAYTDDSWSPPSTVHHHQLDTIAFGPSPAPALLNHLVTPNCSFFIVDTGGPPRNASLSNNAYHALTYIARHISAASFHNVKITWDVHQVLPRRHLIINGIVRTPDSYEVRLSLPARFGLYDWYISRLVDAVMWILRPVIKELEIGVEFNWQQNDHSATVIGTEPLILAFGWLPKVRTLTNRGGIDHKLLRMMRRPLNFGNGTTWLFAELDSFVVEKVSSREMATRLLEMVKCRFMGVASNYDFGDESDDEDDEPTAPDSEELDEFEAGASTDDDLPGNAQPSNIIPGPPLAPPPLWRKLELFELQVEHAEICAEIFEVAQVSPTFEHV